MENLTPYEIKILKKLSKYENGLSIKELEKRFGDEAKEILYNLSEKNIVIREYLKDDMNNGVFVAGGNRKISKNGKAILKLNKSVKAQNNRQKWEERIWTFLIGFATGILTSIIINLLTK